MFDVVMHYLSYVVLGIAIACFMFGPSIEQKKFWPHLVECIETYWKSFVLYMIGLWMYIKWG